MNRRNFLVSAAASSLTSSALGRTAASLSNANIGVGEAPQHSDQLPSALRDQLRRDPFRPQFHLLPRSNWMNDPCAPRFYRGQYHVFFQYNPGAAVWGDMHWAHATSRDLMHWTHQPIALAPSAGSFDAYGIFTGSVLPGMASPSVIYTGVSRSSSDQETMPGAKLREVQCIATCTDAGLRTWKKLDKPVIEAPPAGARVAGFRDPCPWKDGDTWYLILGSGFRKVGGNVLLYRSADGHNWEYLHPLAQGTWNGRITDDGVDSGEMWECPDFFPLGDKHVLLYSTERKVYWEVGVFDKGELRFHGETRGTLDHGSYYAMKSMVDAKGRRLLWGWVTEPRTNEELRQAGWAGSMALPRVLTLGPDDRLRMDVPPEFAGLLSGTKSGHAGAGLTFGDRVGAVVCSFRPGTEACGLELRSGATPLLTLQYDGRQPSLAVAGKPLALSPNQAGLSTVHLWMDGSIVEIFVDSREAVTVRSFAGTAGPVQVTWTGDKDALHTLDVSGVKPISADRLTS